MIRAFLAIALLWAGFANAQQVTSAGTPIYPPSTFAALPNASAVASGWTYRVSDVGVNGSLWFSNGTKWGVVNGSTVLVQNNMPWILISSGSISAGGALTGITALLHAYPQAWIYLPANSLSASHAAGWFYATFSTTTAATVFLNQPTAAFPVAWPGSPTAVTAGQGAYTSFETGNGFARIPTVPLVANSLGINGKLRFVAEINHSGTGSSSVQPVIAAAGMGSVAVNSNASNIVQHFVNAAGAANKQNILAYLTGTSSTQAHGLTAIDYTTDQTLTYQMQAISTTTDNYEMVGYSVYLDNDGQ